VEGNTGWIEVVTNEKNMQKPHGVEGRELSNKAML